MGELQAMSADEKRLLVYLEPRKIVFLLPRDMIAAESAHRKGWVALNGNAGAITDEGRWALRSLPTTDEQRASMEQGS